MIKKINQKGFAAAQFILILIVVAIVGFAGWYVWQQQQDTNNTLNNFGDSEPTTNVSPTPTPTTESTKNELDTLKEHCQSNTSLTVSSVQYIEDTNGKFGNCSMTSNQGGGGILIAVHEDEAWKTIYEGNGVFEESLCAQYKVPSAIISVCTGNY